MIVVRGLVPGGAAMLVSVRKCRGCVTTNAERRINILITMNNYHGHGSITNTIHVQDGRIIPGDRVMYVHTPLATTHLTRASLDVAVQALKGAPLGPVKIGETRQ